MTADTSPKPGHYDLLVIEDSAYDFELEIDALRETGLLVEARRVEDEAAFVSAIAERVPDAILADWTLPRFSGRRALEVAQESCSEVPFIFVSGTISEASAIEALRRGATDYVYKHQLSSLAPALERAIAEVTSRRVLRERTNVLATIAEAARDAIILIDADGNVLFFNSAAERIFGYSAAEIMGNCLHDMIVPKRYLGAYAEGFAKFRDSGEGAAVGRTTELVAVRRDGSEFPVEISLSGVQVGKHWQAVGIVRDITERKRAEAVLQGLNRALRMVSRCNEVLIRATDEATLLHDMCRTIVELGLHSFAWVGYAEHDEAKSIRPVARFGRDDGYLDSAAISWAENERGMGPTGTAIRTGIAQINQNFATNPLMAPWREEALKRGFAASVALPLTGNAGCFGALTIYARAADAFDEEEIALLSELASDLAFGIVALQVRQERDQAQKDLQLAAKVFEEANEGIVITDAEQRILAVNRSFTTITGFEGKDVLGQSPRIMKSDRHDRSFFDNMWASIGQTGHWMGEIWDRRKSGEVFPALQSISAVRDADGNLTNYLSIFADITHIKQSEERIRYLTQHDALTGLANRNLLTDRLEQAIVPAGRSGRNVAVVLIDIDRFKMINDSLGHAAGDTLLNVLAQRLSAFIRPGDSVARPGGGEFTLVLADIASENDVAVLTQKIAEIVATPISVNGQEIIVTASLGVAMFPKDGDTAGVLLKNADAAMYRAKELGRNGVQFYAPEMNSRMLERLELESALRHAIERQEFVLHFQPQVELTHGQIVGAEGLIRWQHPAKGLVAPAAFIGLAEETGLIVDIGQWVIESACRQIKAWHDAGFSDISVSINLAARQFQQENLVELIARTLKQNGVQPKYLELEITESAAMQDPERSIRILRELKRIGVHIALDDFGTGYSSLNYIKRFPIDSLKIDQSFVRDITSAPEDAAIATSVISLAHSLKHIVIAEGVETESQLAILRRHGCDRMQGYLFSRPVEADEFTRQLRENKVIALTGEQATGADRTLLLLDDEPNVLASLRRLLRRDGYRILTAGSASEAFELLAVNTVQVILSDQRMPEMSGSEFLSRVKVLYPDTIRLVLSGYTELNSITEAINQGAIYKFLTKPWDDDMLREHVRDAFVFYESKHSQLQRST
jgi:diguanylate cyclase (GGDEF)-like protein/PAS domain S-box-containing protein